jgi:hypothetical protein
MGRWFVERLAGRCDAARGLWPGVEGGIRDTDDSISDNVPFQNELAAARVNLLTPA